VLAPLLVATFVLAKRVSRLPTLISLLVASIIYSLGTCVLCVEADSRAGVRLINRVGFTLVMTMDYSRRMLFACSSSQ